MSITPQGCIFTLRHAKWFGFSVKKYVETYLQVFELLKYKDFRKFPGEWLSMCKSFLLKMHNIGLGFLSTDLYYFDTFVPCFMYNTQANK